MKTSKYARHLIFRGEIGQNMLAVSPTPEYQLKIFKRDGESMNATGSRNKLKVFSAISAPSKQVWTPRSKQSTFTKDLKAKAVASISELSEIQRAISPRVHLKAPPLGIYPFRSLLKLQ